MYKQIPYHETIALSRIKKNLTRHLQEHKRCSWRAVPASTEVGTVYYQTKQFNCSITNYLIHWSRYYGSWQTLISKRLLIAQCWFAFSIPWVERVMDENTTAKNISWRFTGIQHTILGWNDKELDDGLFVYVYPIHYESWTSNRRTRHGRKSAWVGFSFPNKDE